MGRTLQLGDTQVDETKLADLCGRYRVRELSLFGSAARGDMRPDSDIDMLVSYDGLSTPKLSCSSGPTNGRPEGAAKGVCICPLSLISVSLRNGPERSRARRFCAAKRTLDSEDRSGRWR